MVRLSDEIVMSADGERQLAENVDVNDSPLHQDSDSTDSPYDTEDRIPRGKYKKHVDCKIYRPEKPKKLVEHLDMDLQECYDMGSFPRGVLVVFNMHTFTATTGLEDYPRKGKYYLLEFSLTPVKKKFDQNFLFLPHIIFIFFSLI